MVHYKLVYFDFRGLGEPIRLMLHYLGQEFEDVQLKKSEWPAIKESTPYGHVPILHVDDKVLAEGRCIARFIGKEHGLAGKDNFEQERLSSIADFLMDTFRSFFPYVLVSMGHKDYQSFITGQPPSKELGEMKAKLRAELWEPNTKQDFPKLVKLLTESGSGFFSKDGVTWVDFFVASLLSSLAQGNPDTFQAYPELVEHAKRVHELPKVKEYVAQRPADII